MKGSSGDTEMDVLHVLFSAVKIVRRTWCWRKFSKIFRMYVYQNVGHNNMHEREAEWDVWGFFLFFKKKKKIKNNLKFAYLVVLLSGRRCSIFGWYRKTDKQSSCFFCLLFLYFARLNWIIEWTTDTLTLLVLPVPFSYCYFAILSLQPIREHAGGGGSRRSVLW